MLSFTPIAEAVMPHLLIEYSANLEPKLNIPSLVQVTHEATLETGLSAIGGIRTRAQRHSCVADGPNENAFIHIEARIGAGRTRDPPAG
jgi:5-carboxymethyl-2-hydroxymuconate isomerase